MRTAFIPARGGSKRIPRKNIRPFLGKPMISWPIQACLESNLFSQVIVSTDDFEIADIAKGLGARSVARPAHLSGDFAGTTAVVQDFMKAEHASIKTGPFLYCIYPTSYLDSVVIRNFVEFTEASASSFAVTVGVFPNSIKRSMFLDESQRLTPLFPDKLGQRTQDLATNYFDAGKIYGGHRDLWLKTESPLADKPRAFCLESWASVDLDTDEDWKLGEALASEHKKGRI